MNIKILLIYSLIYRLWANNKSSLLITHASLELSVPFKVNDKVAASIWNYVIEWSYIRINA